MTVREQSPAGCAHSVREKPIRRYGSADPTLWCESQGKE